jgi:REP element-mobilizing transposase RayT
VTLKIRSDVPSLRSSRRFAVVRRCFAKARGLHGMWLVDFSVLDNHLHLLVEADAKRSLSHGMQGLCVRLAHRLNAFLNRSGSLFADHYHSRLFLVRRSSRTRSLMCWRTLRTTTARLASIASPPRHAARTRRSQIQ